MDVAHTQLQSEGGFGSGELAVSSLSHLLELSSTVVLSVDFCGLHFFVSPFCGLHFLERAACQLK